ncbi:MAG: GNAT family N-acetyltransferase, partial [Caldilineaceae bacterium]|nr:GNAT family N-acetyltransferase [Caldilineaceae bacterium]
MLHIDPFAATDVEYAAVVAVNHALYADDDSNVEEMRHYDSSRNPDYLYQRYVLRWDDDIAGYGMLYVPYWAYVPGRYSLYIAVHPTYQRRGIGSAFYDFALEQLAQQEEAVSVVHAHTRSETPH